MSMSSSNTTQSIIKSVRSRLLTLKVKHTAAVVEVESKWGINLKKVPGFNPVVFHERVSCPVCCVILRNKGLALCFGNRLGNVAKWDVSLSDSYPRVVPRNGISALGVGSQCEQEFYPSLCDALYKSPFLRGDDDEVVMVFRWFRWWRRGGGDGLKGGDGVGDEGWLVAVKDGEPWWQLERRVAAIGKVASIWPAWPGIEKKMEERVKFVLVDRVNK
ncbi:hypothetical protein Tco_1147065 [Tanacetum coccineum]